MADDLQMSLARKQCQGESPVGTAGLETQSSMILIRHMALSQIHSVPRGPRAMKYFCARRHVVFAGFAVA